MSRTLKVHEMLLLVLSCNTTDYRSNKKKKMDFDLNDRKDHKLH